MVLFFMIVVHISICNYCTSSSTVLSSGSGTVLYHFDAEINLAVLYDQSSVLNYAYVET
jgi:hypothetical protein